MTDMKDMTVARNLALLLLGVILGGAMIGYFWDQERVTYLSENTQLRARLLNSKSLSWRFTLFGNPLRYVTVLVYVYRDATEIVVGRYETDSDGFIMVTVNGTFRYLSLSQTIMAYVKLGDLRECGYEQWMRVSLPLGQATVEVGPRR